MRSRPTCGGSAGSWLRHTGSSRIGGCSAARLMTQCCVSVERPLHHKPTQFYVVESLTPLVHPGGAPALFGRRPPLSLLLRVLPFRIILLGLVLCYPLPRHAKQQGTGKCTGREDGICTLLVDAGTGGHGCRVGGRRVGDASWMPARTATRRLSRRIKPLASPAGYPFSLITPLRCDSQGHRRPSGPLARVGAVDGTRRPPVLPALAKPVPRPVPCAGHTKRAPNNNAARPPGSPRGLPGLHGGRPGEWLPLPLPQRQGS